MVFRDGWVNVGGVSSHVLTWGGWIHKPLPPGGTILLFMCGVPGLTFFYKTFLEELYNRLKIPIWTICIAGHEIPLSESGLQLPEDTKLYNNVKAQANHKMEFIDKYVPRDQKIIFIGHSFGAKMVIELLKDEKVLSQTEKCVLLMPTIERFADLPRAKFWLTLKNTGLIYFVVLCIWIFSLLPLHWRRKVSQWYFESRGFKNVDKYCLEAMTDFISTPVLFNNVRALVFNELTEITDLDVKVLRKVKDRIQVYFAMYDYWAPLTHYHSLKVAVPDVSVEILDSEFQHAFTVNTSQKMADIIIDELKDRIHMPVKTTNQQM